MLYKNIKDRDPNRRWVHDIDAEIKVFNDPPYRRIYIDHVILAEYMIGSKFEEATALVMLAKNKSVSVPDLATAFGLHHKTIYGYIYSYEANGLEGLRPAAEHFFKYALKEVDINQTHGLGTGTEDDSIPYTKKDGSLYTYIDFSKINLMNALKAAVFNIRCHIKDIAREYFKEYRELSKFLEVLMQTGGYYEKGEHQDTVYLNPLETPAYQAAAEKLVSRISQMSPMALGQRNKPLVINFKL